MKFADKVIDLWVIIYDHDTDRMYTFTSFAHVLASIDASIRGYLCNEPICDSVCGKLIDTVAEMRHQCVIPIILDGLQIFVYKWELDKTSKIHRVLSHCYDEVSGDLREEITSLFRDIIL